MSVKFLVVVPWLMWTWCRSHRLVSVLLVVIAIQQVVIAGAVFVIRDYEKRHERDLYKIRSSEFYRRIQDFKQAHDESNPVHQSRTITIRGYCGTGSPEW